MKTGEIFTMELTNPGAKFKSIGQQFGDHVAHFNAVGKLVDEDGELVFPTYDMDWELIRKPVDFMTAVNSGKRIKPNVGIWDYASPDLWVRNLLELHLINGKWLIK